MISKNTNLIKYDIQKYKFISNIIIFILLKLFKKYFIQINI